MRENSKITAVLDKLCALLAPNIGMNIKKSQNILPAFINFIDTNLDKSEET